MKMKRKIIYIILTLQDKTNDSLLSPLQSYQNIATPHMEDPKREAWDALGREIG